jgi:CysZ protein
MSDIVAALGRALAALVHPKMFFLMIWPIAVAIVIWSVIAVIFGAQALSGVQSALSGYAIFQQFSSTPPWATITTVLLWILGFLLFIPLVLVTAILIIGVFSMPMMVRHVAARDYPGLEMKHGGSVGGSVANALGALARLVLLVVVSLPLWLIPFLWPIIPVVLFGYFNQRLFRYDALAEHASTEEIRKLVSRYKPQLWGLGMILGVIGHVPILGFFMPVFGGLAFIYFLLDRLALERRTPIVAKTGGT